MVAVLWFLKVDHLGLIRSAEGSISVGLDASAYFCRIYDAAGEVFQVLFQFCFNFVLLDFLWAQVSDYSTPASPLPQDAGVEGYVLGRKYWGL